MRILLLLSESWNDIVFPNNNMTNWFKDIAGAEIWTISGSAVIPYNQCCKNFFLISEKDMLKSIIYGSPAGRLFVLNTLNNQAVDQKTDSEKTKRLKKFFSGETARLCRDCVWRYGKYNLEQLESFIKECNPDVVFSQRRGSIKMCRLESVVASMTSAPMIAYTGDDEYSLHQFSLSPIFWIRKFWVRAWLKKMVPQYRLLYSQSRRQMAEYEYQLHVRTKFLVKCGEFSSEKVHKSVGKPIQIVYAGKLYCNRWKTLKIIADEIRAINVAWGEARIQLRIYTADAISNKQNKCLNDGINTIICGKVSASELSAIYSQSDIVLHVESFDLKNRLLTQDSFSTKVIDCLASGCAVMAVCWEGHAAYQYLKEKDAAILASNSEEIRKRLERISSDSKYICHYAQNAYNCGRKYHQRVNIQRMMIEDIHEVMGR